MHSGIGHSPGAPTHFILQRLRVNIWLQNIIQTHRSQSPKSLHCWFDALKNSFALNHYFLSLGSSNTLPVHPPVWQWMNRKLIVARLFEHLNEFLHPLKLHHIRLLCNSASVRSERVGFSILLQHFSVFLLAFFFNRVSLMNMRVLLAISVLMSCVCVLRRVKECFIEGATHNTMCLTNSPFRGSVCLQISLGENMYTHTNSSKREPEAMEPFHC